MVFVKIYENGATKHRWVRTFDTASEAVKWMFRCSRYYHRKDHRCTITVRFDYEPEYETTIIHYRVLSRTEFS